MNRLRTPFSGSSLLGILFCSATLAFGQAAPTPAGAPPTPALSVHAANESSAPVATGSMLLNAVVTDKAGKAIPNLAVGDFQLFDNGRPMPILSFKAIGGSSPAQAPTRVIIVFDAVNMPFESVSYTREQVGTFLKQNGGHLAYPVSLAFMTNSGMQLQTEAGTDGNELAKHLEETASSLRTVGAAAGTWGAIERFDFSIKMLATLAQAIKNQPGRKLVIWAGPGWPMLNEPGIEFSFKGQKQFFDSVVQLNAMLREGQIELSSVAQGTLTTDTFLYESYLKGVKKPTQALPPNLALKVLATQSGGRVVPPTNDLAQSIDTVLQDAGTYYEITFEPPRPDGPNEFHELKLKVNQSGLTAHTTMGYYGQPQAASAP